MLCLSCGSQQADAESHCLQCSAFLGYAAEGRGFLPQLRHLQEQLQGGQIPQDEGEERLIRMDETLTESLTQIDHLGTQIMALPLDEVQRGTVGGFLHPVRDALLALRGVAANLALTGNWSAQDWEQLEQTQARLLQANQGIAYLHQTLAELSQP